uniref:Uncharacterized protein n=1 Tax=viral metagenome TaxID=1070528 RepID=A0A6C0LSI6_9ZZZZ
MDLIGATNIQGLIDSIGPTNSTDMIELTDLSTGATKLTESTI